ncbi:hypothetical protein F5B21DRAFT_505015 [Xylaria acuta]|nr:hypothetical protein F5B21DRAFT_505015 [Xylaria acuta]
MAPTRRSQAGNHRGHNNTTRPTGRSRAQINQQSHLLSVPIELFQMIIEFVLMEFDPKSDPKNQLFWYICGNRSHLADLLKRTHCQYQHPEGGPRTRPWVERSKQILGAQYAVYAAIRGNKISSLLRIHRCVKEVVKRHYTFLQPLQKAKRVISSPLGYWVHNYDAVMPASIENLGYPISHFPFPLPPFAPASFDNMRTPILPSPSSLFPWSRVRNLHLPDGSLSSTVYKEIVDRLPKLERIYILSALNRYSARVSDGSNPHTTTTKSLKRVETSIMFEDQGSLGVEPPHSSGKLSRDNYSHEIREALQLCRDRGIGIVELDNTCPECPKYNRYDFAVMATSNRMGLSRRI